MTMWKTMMLMMMSMMRKRNGNEELGFRVVSYAHI